MPLKNGAIQSRQVVGSAGASQFSRSPASTKPARVFCARPSETAHLFDTCLIRQIPLELWRTFVPWFWDSSRTPCGLLRARSELGNFEKATAEGDVGRSACVVRCTLLKLLLHSTYCKRRLYTLHKGKGNGSRPSARASSFLVYFRLWLSYCWRWLFFVSDSFGR